MDGLSGCLELLKSDDELALVLDVVSSPWTDRVVVGRKSRDGCAMKGLSGVRRRGERAEHHLCLLLKSGRASVDRTVNSIERRPLGDVAFWPAATAHGEARTPDTLTASPSLHLLAESCHLPACQNSRRITCRCCSPAARQAREPGVSLGPKQCPWAKLGSSVGPCAPPMSLERGRDFQGCPSKSDRNQAAGCIFASCLAKPTTDRSNKQPCQPPTNPFICATSLYTPTGFDSHIGNTMLTADLALATRAASATSS